MITIIWLTNQSTHIVTFLCVCVCVCVVKMLKTTFLADFKYTTQYY